ncbi:hypothetical protein [Hellea balneolensis]|uniref:hypothetical protein n=1 Tax=Hellea balneolensis TaxID=287478 RepID=UPI0012B78D93|nr:hypothetical protein [Hellea balneolensis]
MTTGSTRLGAVKMLLEDEAGRRVRENWESIFSDKSLTPETQTAEFEQHLYDLLITEMEEGYRRKEVLQKEKRKRTGRSSGYIPPQMRVSPDIGRFIFACFKWHGFSEGQTTANVEVKGLEDLAEAFNFKIDPMENKRQFISGDERKTAIEKEESASYNLRIWGLIIGGLFITFAIVIRYLMRRNGM